MHPDTSCPLCLLHANCQGDELKNLLLASAAFTANFRLQRYTNYTREPIPPEELARCSALLYQQLDASWGELSSARLREMIPEQAAAVKIPNLFFKGYWPLWTGKGRMDFGDSLLNRLLEEGTPKSVILKLYLHRDLGNIVDFQDVFDKSVALERRKEAGACALVTDYWLEHWRARPMFHTVNHPGRGILIRVANGILDALGLPALRKEEIASVPGFPSYADFDLPIHPQVAAFHKLAFAGPGHRFAVFGRTMSFEQYISRYIDCWQNGLADDFTGYLQVV